jgi:hypothetical protein
MYDFPAAPLLGDLFTDPVNGMVYTWNGYGWLADGVNKYVLKSGDTMTGYLTLYAQPTDPMHAATKQYVDAVAPPGTYVLKVGDTMQGFLSLFTNPTAPMHAATKEYVDVANYVVRSGDTMTGFLTLNADPTALMHAATKQYVDTNYVEVAGDTLTGYLTLHANPSLPMHAATMMYVDSGFAGLPPPIDSYTKTESDAKYVELIGDTMSGFLTLSADPTALMHAATKQYVDNAVALGDPRFVNVIGDTMTGDLYLNRGGGNTGALFFGTSGAIYLYYDGAALTLQGQTQLSVNPTQPMHTATKQYVDTAIAAIPPPPPSGLDQATADGLYVNVAGDTMSGQLNVPALWSSGTLTVSGNSGLQATTTTTLFASGLITGSQRININGPSALLELAGVSGLWNAPDGMAMGQIVGGNTGSQLWTVAGDHADSYTNMTRRPAGGPWASWSDARIKNVIDEYTTGLEAIRQLRPVNYSYKGNDTRYEPTHAPIIDENGNRMPDPETPPIAPYGNSPHHGVVTQNLQFVGLIAQEVETVFPNTVRQEAGFIDGQPVTDLRGLDTSELTYALINAVKEIASRIEALETQLAATRK